MIERSDADRWLNSYIEAWKSNDPGQIAALFTDACPYRFYPYDEPTVGGAAIAAAWLEKPDEPGSFQATYRTIAVDDDLVVAQGESLYYSDGRLSEAFDNIFVMTFDDAGLCSSFVEYYVRRPAPGSQAGAQ
jgi:hypothetical protein